MNKPGGRLHTSTQKGLGKGMPGKMKEQLEKLKTITMLMDQYSLTDKYWSRVFAGSDYFFAGRGPRPAARNSSNAWRLTFDRRVASERERWPGGAIEGTGPKGSEDDRTFCAVG